MTDLTLGRGEEYELRAPTDAPTYNLDDEREARIVAWRVKCFERAGMPALDAIALGVRRDVDRQRVEDMLSAGARPELVREIVL